MILKDISGNSNFNKKGLPIRFKDLELLIKKDNKSVISNVEGIVHTGELLLIIGPNSDILLRSLSSPSDITLTESSHLDYGLLPPSILQPSLSPLPTSTTAPCLRSEVIYLNSKDAHFATLSLRASLLPGALATTPSNRSSSDGLSRKELAEKKLKIVLERLGLSHALETKIGSPIVKGLSGGERRRASIAEALLTDGSVLLMENVTNGLDSNTALKTLQYIKEWASEGKRSVVVTAPHLADNLFELFDKVLVLDSRGRQVYFGKTEEVSSYFERLGMGFKKRNQAGEGVVEFVVNCIERRGNDRELEKSWGLSTQKKLLAREMDEYESIYSDCAESLLSTLRSRKSPFTPKSSHFTVNFFDQVSILTRRQYSLIFSELPTYVTKTLVNLSLSILVGTLFFQLPTTTSGAFTRASLLLLSIMFNAYLSLAELGKAIEGREVVKRQAAFGFFSASALALSRIAGDLPLIGGQVLLFGSITYSLGGLQLSIERFTIYILFVYATALNLSSMFRLFAAFSPTFDVAIRYCGITLNILVVYAGYFVPTSSMRSGLKWIHYIVDPISRSYEAVLTNEFHNLNLTCSPLDIIPSGPSYPNNPLYQTCLLPGSIPGSLFVLGDDYLSTAYDFHYDNVWNNLGILFLQAVVFLIIGIWATEWFEWYKEGGKIEWVRTERVKNREKWLKKKRGDEEGWIEEAEVEVEEEEEDVETEEGKIEGSILIWKDVSLWIDTPLETRRLLDNISGYIKPGTLTALCGVSGAGKSTLLNVLAGRTGGVVKGKILVDGIEPDDDFYSSMGFVEQNDLHDERSTVREALEFSAHLRGRFVDKKEQVEYVNFVLEILSLTHLQDAIIGTSSNNEGLNLEQRKRLTIAVEVVSRPKMLFCDEPTTGLTTKMASRLVKLLKRLARTGIAVVATIHQPSKESFEIFDDLLLLKRGGKQIYFGPRDKAVQFFTSSLTPLDSSINPAEFLLDISESGLNSNDEDAIGEEVDSLAYNWKFSTQAGELETILDNLALKKRSSSYQSASISASILQQIIELTARVSRNFYRDTSYSYTKFFTATVVSAIIGLSFFQLGNTIVSFQNRLFSIFLILFVPPVFMNVSIFKIFLLRGLFEAREGPSKIYGKFAFATSLLFSELPYSVVCGTIYFVLWYFLVGLPLEIGKIFFAFIMVQFFFFFQATWSMWITALAPSLGTIANLLPFFLVSMECFNGALMPYALMPTYYRWLYWISPFQSYVRALSGSLFTGIPVVCSASELVSFHHPPNETCISYSADYISINGGYLVDQVNTSIDEICQYCRFSSGDEYLSSINIAASDRYFAMGIFAFYCFTNVLLTYLFTFYPPVEVWNWIRGGKKESTAEKVAGEVFERERHEGNRILNSARGAFE